MRPLCFGLYGLQKLVVLKSLPGQRQLLAGCDALEQYIQQSRRLAGQLLQTALREAWARQGDGGAIRVERRSEARAQAGKARNGYA